MTRAERSLVLPPVITSVRVGRHFARDVLLEWDLAQLADDVQLATTELITNAVRHARTEYELALRLDQVVTVEVRDLEPELPEFDVLEAEVVNDPEVDHGRGLQIVAAICDDWGVTADGRGKSIWFTLRLPDENSADADVFSLADSRRADGAEPVEFDDQTREQARGAS